MSELLSNVRTRLLISVFRFQESVFQLSILRLQILNHLKELLVDLCLILPHRLLRIHVGHEKLARLLVGPVRQEGLELPNFLPKPLNFAKVDFLGIEELSLILSIVLILIKHHIRQF